MHESYLLNDALYEEFASERPKKEILAHIAPTNRCHSEQMLCHYISGSLPVEIKVDLNLFKLSKKVINFPHMSACHKSSRKQGKM